MTTNKYQGEDIGLQTASTSALPTSARRYATTNPKTVTTPEDIEQYYTVLEPQTQRGHMLQQELRRRGRQPHTDEPIYDIRPTSKSIPARRHARISRRSLIFGGCGLLLAGVGIGTWIVPESISLANALEVGKLASTERSLVCGHNDSLKSPTILRASLEDDGCIDFTEIPGGNRSETRIFTTESIRAFYTDSLQDVYIQINANQVGDGKYQIDLYVRAGRVGLFQSPSERHWILIDNGQGYFQAVQPSHKVK